MAAKIAPVPQNALAEREPVREVEVAQHREMAGSLHRASLRCGGPQRAKADVKEQAGAGAAQRGSPDAPRSERLAGAARRGLDHRIGRQRRADRRDGADTRSSAAYTYGSSGT